MIDVINSLHSNSYMCIKVLVQKANNCDVLSTNFKHVFFFKLSVVSPAADYRLFCCPAFFIYDI